MFSERAHETDLRAGVLPYSPETYALPPADCLLWLIANC